ncbi:MAG: FMN-binding protein [Oscillospiraceae bacterium]|jgi:major membrane immunogen (membrane-anchored lipoprotein)|nr:FMN-binding protein [Oscillospiraceae bacterium]
MKLRRVLPVVLSLLCALSVAGCAPKAAERRLKDGYYTAEAAIFEEHGWKEFVTICVRDGQIINVEYNAKNRTGFLKSWDMVYMREMNAVSHTYPNQYTRLYAQGLLEAQSPDGVDLITGATESYETFMQLADAVMYRAQTGDTSVSFVLIDEPWKQAGDAEGGASQ